MTSAEIIDRLKSLANGNFSSINNEEDLKFLEVLTPVKWHKATRVAEVKEWSFRRYFKGLGVRGIIDVKSSMLEDGATLIFKDEKQARQAFKKIPQVAKVVSSEPSTGNIGDVFVAGLGEPKPDQGDRWSLYIKGFWTVVNAIEGTIPEGDFVLIEDPNSGYGGLVELDRKKGFLYSTIHSQKYRDKAHEKLLEMVSTHTEKRVVNEVKSGHGTCPSCFRAIRLTGNNIISRHGWQVSGGRRKGQWGLTWHSGPCFGTGWSPYEVSAEGTEAFRKVYVDRYIPEIEKRLSFFQNRPESLIVNNRKGEPITLLKSSGEPYEKALTTVIRSTQEQLAGLTRDVKFLTEAIQDWKPQETQKMSSRVVERYLGL